MIRDGMFSWGITLMIVTITLIVLVIVAPYIGSERQSSYPDFRFNSCNETVNNYTVNLCDVRCPEYPVSLTRIFNADDFQYCNCCGYKEDYGEFK